MLPYFPAAASVVVAPAAVAAAVAAAAAALLMLLTAIPRESCFHNVALCWSIDAWKAGRKKRLEKAQVHNMCEYLIFSTSTSTASHYFFPR